MSRNEKLKNQSLLVPQLKEDKADLLNKNKALNREKITMKVLHLVHCTE
jgi:hypothetical protein